ncbi:adenosylcobinamide-phosphate synthase CbiB [Halotalea alkalilenta]|uniref:Cobalamin biosynthesis protein CobD n=1 Tax=Halotalea alkalilenta TaxID=376489 RepID=A0A172YFR5_9GAMM|nr:adenosylcobinamide-phosphate synthase CbiB [Halotalea alkalilenta]ANF58047.1 cobalamin biosynthesis protein [Halotalea alkalilenta]
MTTLAALLLGCLLDRLCGEPLRWHPLIGLGRWIGLVEARAHGERHARARGLLAWVLVVAGPVAVAVVLQGVLNGTLLYVLVAALVVYLSIGWHSLIEHAGQVAEPLRHGELDQARGALAMIVSRDTAELDETGIATAATESVLENGSDAIYAALFWFALLGLPGVVLYRCANTLDAMWGYKNPRYRQFGWAAARIDDLLNWIPARLTVFAYACASGSASAARLALDCAWRQGRRWKSPNAGPVMAAGAGALGLLLGGPSRYHGVLQERGDLGQGRTAKAADILRACRLIDRALIFWLVLLSAVLLFARAY